MFFAPIAPFREPHVLAAPFTSADPDWLIARDGIASKANTDTNANQREGAWLANWCETCCLARVEAARKEFRAEHPTRISASAVLVANSPTARAAHSVCVVLFCFGFRWAGRWAKLAACRNETDRLWLADVLASFAWWRCWLAGQSPVVAHRLDGRCWLAHG